MGKRTPRERNDRFLYYLNLYKKEFILLTIISCIPGYYLLTKIGEYESSPVKLGELFFLAGALFQSKKIVGSWISLLVIIAIAYLFSLVLYIPIEGLNEYELEIRLKFWPTIFMFIFIPIVSYYYFENITPRLTKAGLMVLSLGFLYSFIDLFWLKLKTFGEFASFAFLVAISLFYIVKPFRKKEMKEVTWTMMISWYYVVHLFLVSFSLVNIDRVPGLEQINDMWEKLALGLQYFLLGMSVYQLFLDWIFPAIDRYLQENDKNLLKKIEAMHTSPELDALETPRSSFLILLVCTVFFFVNQTFKLIPVIPAAWLAYFLYTGISNLIYGPKLSIKKRQKGNNSIEHF